MLSIPIKFLSKLRKSVWQRKSAWGVPTGDPFPRIHLFCRPAHCPNFLPRIVEASIEGQSTFGMQKTSKKKEVNIEKLKIVKTSVALR